MPTSLSWRASRAGALRLTDADESIETSLKFRRFQSFTYFCHIVSYIATFPAQTPPTFILNNKNKNNNNNNKTQ